jgi:hypothetical protein
MFLSDISPSISVIIVLVNRVINDEMVTDSQYYLGNKFLEKNLKNLAFPVTFLSLIKLTKFL